MGIWEFFILPKEKWDIMNMVEKNCLAISHLQPLLTNWLIRNCCNYFLHARSILLSKQEAN
jgi:hypothetical protein